MIGYARVSYRGQSLDAQVDALVGAGAIEVFMEHASGATQARARWQDCLEHLQPGNILVVADLTRLGRGAADLSDIVTALGRRGIDFRSLAEPWLDTTSAHGKLIFDMFDLWPSTNARGCPNALRPGWRQRKPGAGSAAVLRS